MAEGPNIARFISEVSLTPSPTAESHFHSPLSHLGQVQVPSSSLPPWQFIALSVEKREDEWISDSPPARSHGRMNVANVE